MHRLSDAEIWDAAAEAASIHSGVLPFLHGGVRLGLMRLLHVDTAQVLTGEGADEHFFGYPYFAHTPHHYDPCRGQPDLMRWSRPSTRTIANPRQALINEMSKRLEAVLARPIASSACPAHAEGTRAGNALLATQARLDCRRILTNYSLRFLGNQLDQAAGVTSVCPFLETDVVGAACRVPPHWHLWDGRGKYLLRRLAADNGLVPDEILSRPKRAFIRGLRNDFPWHMYARFLKLMDPNALEDVGLFDAALGLPRFGRQVCYGANASARAADSYFIGLTPPRAV